MLSVIWRGRVCCSASGEFCVMIALMLSWSLMPCDRMHVIDQFEPWLRRVTIHGRQRAQPLKIQITLEKVAGFDQPVRSDLNRQLSESVRDRERERFQSLGQRHGLLRRGRL